MGAPTENPYEQSSQQYGNNIYSYSNSIPYSSSAAKKPFTVSDSSYDNYSTIHYPQPINSAYSNFSSLPAEHYPIQNVSYYQTNYFPSTITTNVLPRYENQFFYSNYSLPTSQQYNEYYGESNPTQKIYQDSYYQENRVQQGHVPAGVFGGSQSHQSHHRLFDRQTIPRRNEIEENQRRLSLYRNSNPYNKNDF